MKTFLKIVLFGGLLALATPAFAQIHIGLGISIGPPHPPRERIVVRPYRDAIWIAGYYQWHPRHHRYIWEPGRWERPPRLHSVWVPGRWERRHTEWVFYEGRWDNERLRKR